MLVLLHELHHNAKGTMSLFKRNIIKFFVTSRLHAARNYFYPDTTTRITYTALSCKKTKIQYSVNKVQQASLNLFDVSRKSVVFSAPLWQEIITFRTIISAIPLHVASARVDCSDPLSNIGKRKSFLISHQINIR